MYQHILRNFISEYTINAAINQFINKEFNGPDYLSGWMIFQSDNMETIIPELKDFVNKVSDLVKSVITTELIVKRLIRGYGKTPKNFNITNHVTDDTSYILFISTQTILYEITPLLPSTFLQEGLEAGPIVLNKGDALLLEYNDSITDLNIFSPEMNHFCVVYLEPMHLWP